MWTRDLPYFSASVLRDHHVLAGVISKRFPSTGTPGGRGIGVDIVNIEGQAKLKRNRLKQNLRMCRLGHYTSSLADHLSRPPERRNPFQ